MRRADLALQDRQSAHTQTLSKPKASVKPRLSAAVKPSKKTKPQNKTKKPDAPNSLQILLTLEGEAMAAQDRLSLKHMAVNKPRAIIDTGHIFLIRRTGKKIIFEAISSQSSVEKNSPFLQWLSRILSQHCKQEKSFKLGSFELPISGKDGFDYPYNHALLAPFAPDSREGALLFTRAAPWAEADVAIPARLGQIYGLSWTALGRKSRSRLTPKKRALIGTSLIALALIGLIPVPISTLAPAEIVAAKPFIVSAPMDGVIAELNVLPNMVVKKGDILARFEDTSYRNEYDIAAEELAVSTARLRQAGLSAFVDDQSKRQLAVAKAEQDLSRTRQVYAADILSRTILRAPRDGLLIYTDVKDWIGRPVATGERIMEIADPSHIEIRLEAPIHDSAALIDKAPLKLFLDSDPLRPLSGELSRSSYYASAQPGGALAYEAYGDLSLEDNDLRPRIGTRGVAKIYGEKAPLAFWLARRPLTAIRQIFGA